MKSWKDFDVASRHMIVIIPSFVIFMFANAGIYQSLHSKYFDAISYNYILSNFIRKEALSFYQLPDSCASTAKYNDTISYYASFGYLQTVSFTIGYGHITPQCHAGKVKFV